MPLIKYAVFHLWKVTFTVITGVLLGMTAFYAYQVNAAIVEVAVEEFNPEAVRQEFVDPFEGRNIVFVEPSQYQEEEVDLLGLQEELSTAFDIEKAFDPREFSPHSFGEPIPDDRYTSYLLIGVDASGVLADAIVLALQPAGGGRPIVVSLPRDLYVWNGCKETFTRLNAGLGGCSGVASGSEMMAILVEDHTGSRSTTWLGSTSTGSPEWSMPLAVPPSVWTIRRETRNRIC